MAARGVSSGYKKKRGRKPKAGRRRKGGGFVTRKSRRISQNKALELAARERPRRFPARSSGGSKPSSQVHPATSGDDKKNKTFFSPLEGYKKKRGRKPSTGRYIKQGGFVAGKSRQNRALADHESPRRFSTRSSKSSKHRTRAPPATSDDDKENRTSFNSIQGRPGNLHQYIKKPRDHNAFDINHTVIPYSIASCTRVEKLQYKIISTPKWRIVKNISLSNDEIATLEAGLEEDISDEVIRKMHDKCEEEERKRLMSDPKLIHKVRRRLKKSQFDSKTGTSGTNSPDSLLPTQQNAVFRDSNSTMTVEPISPASSCPSTPLSARLSGDAQPFESSVSGQRSKRKCTVYLSKDYPSKKAVSISKRGCASKEAVSISKRGRPPKVAVPIPKRGRPPKEAAPISKRGCASKEAVPMSKRGHLPKEAVPMSRRGRPPKGAVPISKQGCASKEAVSISKRGHLPKEAVPVPKRGRPPKEPVSIARKGHLLKEAMSLSKQEHPLKEVGSLPEKKYVYLPPYEPRKFPLSDKEYEEMLKNSTHRLSWNFLNPKLILCQDDKVP